MIFDRRLNFIFILRNIFHTVCLLHLRPQDSSIYNYHKEDKSRSGAQIEANVGNTGDSRPCLSLRLAW